MKQFLFLFSLIILFTLSSCKQEVVEVELTATETEEPIATTDSTTAPDATQEPVNKLSFMDKISPDHIRLLNYNVNWDSIFPDSDLENHDWRGAEKVNEFQRMIKAISPDIVCLQEINPERDASQVSAIFDQALPLEDGAKWQAVIAGDNVILSKFELKTNGHTLYIPLFEDVYPQAAALIDLPDDIYGQEDIYLICVHFPAFSNQEAIDSRQAHADAIIRQVGDMKTPGDFIDLEANTPFIFAGDFNAYDDDPRKHIDTLLTGDIVFEDRFGDDVLPDWDNSSLTDLLPSHHGEGQDFYTWRNDESSYIPFSLDRIIFSDSVLSVGNAFILNTRKLSPDVLADLGLQENDVLIYPETGYYDHLPIVVDFSVLGD